MQWLINIIKQQVIDMLGIPPTFVDRGDPLFYDWILAQLTLDGTWNELDLSGIVPAGVTAVMMGGYIRSNNLNDYFFLRTFGNVGYVNVAGTRIIVAASSHFFYGIVYLGGLQKIKYIGSGGGGWTYVALAVRGWWL